MAIADVTSINSAPVSPMGAPPRGKAAPEAAVKTTPKAQSDRVELSIHARLLSLAAGDSSEENPAPDANEQADATSRNLLPEQRLSSPAPTDPVSPPPETPPEGIPSQPEPAKLYEEPEPTGPEQARALRTVGYSLSMIATKMNLDLETVKTYLGVA